MRVFKAIVKDNQVTSFFFWHYQFDGITCEEDAVSVWSDFIPGDNIQGNDHQLIQARAITKAVLVTKHKHAIGEIGFRHTWYPQNREIKDKRGRSYVTVGEQLETVCFMSGSGTDPHVIPSGKERQRFPTAGNWYWIDAMAICSVKDRFEKEIGRRVALRRLIEQVEDPEIRAAIMKTYFNRRKQVHGG